MDIFRKILNDPCFTSSNCNLGRYEINHASINYLLTKTLLFYRMKDDLCQLYEALEDLTFLYHKYQCTFNSEFFYILKTTTANHNTFQLWIITNAQ